MKTLFAVLFVLLFSISLSAQNRFDDAKKTASEKKELIILNFSGSDWCIPCIKLHKNIIETEDFKKLSTDNVLIYLNADFPLSKKNHHSAKIKKKNKALANK